MRNIVYIALTEPNMDIYNECLEMCSTYTPLVEPLSSNDIFIDITGCGKSGKIINNIARHIYNLWKVQLKIGLANSKLLARTAICSKKLPGNKPPIYRVIHRPEAILIQVLPGKEAEFTGALFLKDFYPLTNSAVKKLSRLGFSRVKEIAAISPHQLTNMLGADGYLLSQQSRGIDFSPVLGLFPPLRIIYPLDLEEAAMDSLRIEKALFEAAHILISRLQSRYSGCRNISLEIVTDHEKLIQNRILQSNCYTSEHLFNILKSLVKQGNITSPISGFRIILTEIETLQMCQEDLFSYHIAGFNTQQQIKLKNTLEKLGTSFPGLISQGININRRERVLALWDPWRSFS